ncbi:L,D-transpeptidase family protein [Streptomyces sp. NRRL WC-3742]|uniref:L,D-transpeptidase family protein n=1 Tax=Streptomyces sp. NRRL WC-3742 TaxID=1463934 RepID=UPI000B0903F4|nr:L,D-transpeptidase family protein [Streptomyces sp. NRRL WC-3742]
MSGSHRATTYPLYDPAHEPVYEVPQQEHYSYGEHRTYGQDYGQGYEQGYDQTYRQPYQQSFQQAPDGYFEAYDQPFQEYPAQEQYAPYETYEQPYEPEPVYAYEPEPEPEAAPLAPGPSTEPAAPAPTGSRAAARGHRRKAKKKRGGKAVMAGTALLVAAAAGWYTVGQDEARPGLAAADGPAPDSESRADQPTPAPAAVQAADARQTQPAAAGRSQTRADASVAAIPGLGPTFTAKIPAGTNQVLVATGQDKNTDKNSVTLWTRTPEGRWLAGETWQGHNGKNGWTADHNQGDLRSPIGVFSLTDAGGRLDNPGGKVPYDKDPSFVVSGTGFFGDQLAGSFDYVVAINYNRVAGSSPLDMRRPMGAGKGGGIWLHVDHDGPTHGCVSIPEDKMVQLIRTLDPAAHPVIVMGDTASLAA